MLKVMCPVSLEEAYIDCGCPDDHDAAAEGVHHETCAVADPSLAITCPPSSGCCQEEHSHGKTANSCTADHSGEACPDPAGKCRAWNNAKHHASGGVQPLPAELQGDCPGGHCHQDLESCAGCHALIITLIGNTTLKRAVS
jgi:hypothetical protein